MIAWPERPQRANNSGSGGGITAIAVAPGSGIRAAEISAVASTTAPMAATTVATIAILTLATPLALTVARGALIKTAAATTLATSGTAPIIEPGRITSVGRAIRRRGRLGGLHRSASKESLEPSHKAA